MTFPFHPQGRLALAAGLAIVLSGCDSTPPPAPDPVAPEKPAKLEMHSHRAPEATNAAKSTPSVSRPVTAPSIAQPTPQPPAVKRAAPPTTPTPVVAAQSAEEATGILVEQLKVRAANGDPAAQIDLGVRYANGTGVPKDVTEAARWISAAADGGDPKAQNKLALMYAQGQGIDKDEKQAAAWFERAASQNFVTAQQNLGHAYANGVGVQQDYVQAYKWLTLSARNNPNAQEMLNSFKGSMTPDQIAQGDKLVKDFIAVDRNGQPIPKATGR